MKEDCTARVGYAKTGLIRFVGHLDLCRAIVRAVRRSGLRVRYTAGFSPRVGIAFGPPLPLGYTSEAEWFDLRLAEAYTPDEVARRLQPNLPEGLAIKEVHILEAKPEALSATLDVAEYEIAPPEGTIIDEAVVQALLDRPALVVERNRKGRRRLVDVRPSIRALEVERTAARGTRLRVQIEQRPSGSATPRDLIVALFGVPDEEAAVFRVHRRRCFSSRT